MRSLFRIALVFVSAVLLWIPPASAEDQGATETVSPQIREFVRLLDDPTVQAWIKRNAQAAPPVAAPPAQASPSRYFADRLVAVRKHVTDLIAAAPTLPAQLKRAGAILGLEFQERGIIHILLLIALFVALGGILEWLFRRLVASVAHRAVAMDLETIGRRLRAVGVRFSLGMGMVIAFALGSVGAFLANDWPPLLREIVLGYLLAIVILRTALVVGRFLLAPREEKFRLLPMPTDAARFWYWRIGIAIGWLAFGWVTVGLLSTFGFSMPGRQFIAYGLGLGLLVIALESTWRRPAAPLITGDTTAIPDRRSPVIGRTAVSYLLTGYFALVWLLWAGGMMPAFWLVVMAFALPAAMRLTQRAVGHILRPSGIDHGAGEPPTIVAVLLEHGLRVALIIAAAWLLAHAWHIDLTALAASDTVITRLLRGVVSAVVIILIADIAWRVARGLIDRRIAAAQLPGQVDTDEGRRRSRMRTLLPILRNVLFIVLIVMAILMALSAMGVEIGPLIAGAGVVGVAVGFGAQTLVKDIISGVFYLLDDSFRIGEYIQSGSYKGTVESFSLRSVKLRHHRGPLYTVPFGELGAVENMSRDWVIDKMTIGVTYDTDLDKARKLIKQVGKDLAEDAEYKPNIIETLKMQGVEQFGDFAIQLRMKMTCKPGEQFVIRRKAFAMIKKAFDANGIRFAFPTVQVAGGDASAAAVAQQRIAMTKPALEA